MPLDEKHRTSNTRTSFSPHPCAAQPGLTADAGADSDSDSGAGAGAGSPSPSFDKLRTGQASPAKRERE